MYKLFCLVWLIWPASVLAQQQLNSYGVSQINIQAGDHIKQAQQVLGKPDRAYAVENKYGGVVEFDYVWDQGLDEITMVVSLDGVIVSIWESDNI